MAKRTLRSSILAATLVAVLPLAGGVAYVGSQAAGADEMRWLPPSKWGFVEMVSDADRGAQIRTKYLCLEITRTYPR